MYDITFFTPERYRELFSMVEGILKMASPGVLISVALSMLGLFVTVVIYAFKKGAGTEKEDKDFDIKYLD